MAVTQSSRATRLVALCLALAAPATSFFSPLRRHQHATLRSSPDDDDEAPSVDGEDWRAFRAKLIAGGLATTEEAAEAPAGPATVGSGVGLDPANEALARAQSPSLGDLLEEPSWAHEVGAPEVGGLLLRLPLETQLCVARDSYWGKKLREFHEAEKTREAMAEGRRSGLGASELPARAPAADAGEGALDEVLLYRCASRFLRRELQRVASKGQVDDKGRLLLDPRTLSDADRGLLDMHQRYLSTWQEVVLVTRHDGAAGSDGVVLNRPAATESSDELSAALCVALEREEGADTVAPENFQTAFGPRLAAYVGKPAPGAAPADDGEEKAPKPKQTAMIIHGLAGLKGAEELSPGLGIYKGGSAEAAQRVQDESNDPYDFRFFIGKHEWAPGELERDIREGLYRPAACSRGVALKQCLGLPKPLWHEVMEMLGGTSEEISKLELQRRKDS